MFQLPKYNDSGSVILYTMVIVAILSIIGATLASTITFEYRHADWQRRWIQALYLAEAGLNKGIALVREGWLSGGDGIVPDFDGTLGDIGIYSVQFISVVDAIDITSTGKIPSTIPDKFIERVIGIRMLLSLSPGSSVFNWAAFGDDGLTITGSASTDSYNSGDGLYEDQIPGENGNIGSNNDIRVTGNATIKGSAICGPDPDDELRVTGSVDITGSTDPASESVVLPPLDINFPFPSSGDLRKTGSGTYTLTDGIYCYTDIKFTGSHELLIEGDVTIYCESASFTGTSKITVNGKLTIFCTGDFTCTGSGLVNTSRKPENCILYSTGADIKLTGSSDFHGAVYGVNADASITGGHDYYGSIIVGGEVQGTGNCELHYDEALMDVVDVVSTGGGREVTTASWHAVY